MILILVKHQRWLPWGMLIVSFLGFLDATYLTVKHYRGDGVRCSITSGCEEVLTSQYATFFDIPVALLGGLFYLTLLILSIVYLDTRRDSVIKFASYITIVGFGVSTYFVYLQMFIIEAFCQFCLLSALASTLLFIFGLLVLSSKKNNSSINHQLDDENYEAGDSHSQ